MRVPIPCKNKRFRLTIGIRAIRPCSLTIIGRDAENPNTKYVARTVNITSKYFRTATGYREIQIPFPLSPNFMMLDIWATNPSQDSLFNIEKLEAKAMEPRAIWEHLDIHNFIPFANWFAQKAGYLSTGTYQTANAKYRIDYLKTITNQYGIPMTTPARTLRSNGLIQTSRQHFLPLSIPIRWFILMHERKHFQLPTREEKEADLSALRVFLDYGFPKIEAIYACTIAMQADDHLAKHAKLNRLKDIHQFIDQYIKNKTVQQTQLNNVA